MTDRLRVRVIVNGKVIADDPISMASRDHVAISKAADAEGLPWYVEVIDPDDGAHILRVGPSEYLPE